MSPMHAENSPDESVRCDGGNVNVNRFTLAKEKASNILMAFCLLALIALALLYRYDAQERDLDRYDDSIREKAMNKEIESLKAQVGYLEKLNEACLIKKAVQEQENGRTHNHQK